MESPDTHPTIINQAESFLPTFTGHADKKRAYLSYRLTGFGIREAMKHAKVPERTLKDWRAKDAEFKRIESMELSQERKNFARELLGLDFTRNFKLVLSMDALLFQKAFAALVSPSSPQLTKEERAYLNNARKMYTPQQFDAIQNMMEQGVEEGVTTYEDIIQLRRRKISHGTSPTTQTQDSPIQATVEPQQLIETQYTESSDEQDRTEASWSEEDEGDALDWQEDDDEDSIT